MAYGVVPFILILINAILVIGGIAASVLMIILLVKLALRGIKALDIYIEKNKG